MGARIGDAWRSSIRHKRDGLASFQPARQSRRFPVLVVLVQADQRFADFVVRQEPGRASGVLGGYEVYLAQCPQSAKRQIFEVPDGCCDDEEGAGHGDYNCSLLG